MKGRKPLPTRLKLLRGGRIHRKAKQEPKPAPGIPDCPDFLSAAAKIEWDFITTELAPLGVLAMIDKAVLAGYCSELAAWAECEQFLQAQGSVVVLRDDKGVVKWMQEAPQARLALKHLEKVRQFASELGLSPSSRTRIHITQPEAKTPNIWEQFK